MRKMQIIQEILFANVSKNRMKFTTVQESIRPNYVYTGFLFLSSSVYFKCESIENFNHLIVNNYFMYSYSFEEILCHYGNIFWQRYYFALFKFYTEGVEKKFSKYFVCALCYYHFLNIKLCREL